MLQELDFRQRLQHLGLDVQDLEGRGADPGSTLQADGMYVHPDDE